MADIQVNLVGKHHRKRQSHEIAKRVRPLLEPIAARYGARIKVAEVPPGPAGSLDDGGRDLRSRSRAPARGRGPGARRSSRPRRESSTSTGTSRTRRPKLEFRVDRGEGGARRDHAGDDRAGAAHGRRRGGGRPPAHRERARAGADRAADGPLDAAPVSRTSRASPCTRPTAGWSRSPRWSRVVPTTQERVDLPQEPPPRRLRDRRGGRRAGESRSTASST